MGKRIRSKIMGRDVKLTREGTGISQKWKDPLTQWNYDYWGRIFQASAEYENLTNPKGIFVK